jgi:hypothetical protein
VAAAAAALGSRLGKLEVVIHFQQVWNTVVDGIDVDWPEDPLRVSRLMGVFSFDVNLFRKFTEALDPTYPAYEEYKLAMTVLGVVAFVFGWAYVHSYMWENAFEFKITYGDTWPSAYERAKQQCRDLLLLVSCVCVAVSVFSAADVKSSLIGAFLMFLVPFLFGACVLLATQHLGRLLFIEFLRKKSLDEMQPFFHTLKLWKRKFIIFLVLAAYLPVGQTLLSLIKETMDKVKETGGLPPRNETAADPPDAEPVEVSGERGA